MPLTKALFITRNVNSWNKNRQFLFNYYTENNRLTKHCRLLFGGRVEFSLHGKFRTKNTKERERKKQQSKAALIL